ncbi:hypothetical protein [Nocardia sp. NPDC056100]|uniref:hypothetical protein n=1 Tax=Nocardia sp. NPDC056100 TaxID=3345712 RepID=UPI0035D58BAF
MGITKTIAPVLLSLTAAVALSATATAIPATEDSQNDLRLHGVDHGVAYQSRVSDDYRSTVTGLLSGRFLNTWDGEAVIATDDSGRVIGTIPLKYDIAGKKIEFTSAIDADHRNLTLTPVAQTPTPLRDISAQQRFFDVVQANQQGILTGAGIGAAIGFLLGFPAGLFVFDIITAPVGAVIGGIIGAAIGLQQSGGQPAIDAALGYANSLVPGASDALAPAFEALPAPPQGN